MSDFSFFKILKIEKIGKFSLRLYFNDGFVGERDFTPLIREGGPMVKPLRDEAYFNRVFLEDGALTWPNDFDLDTINLHDNMQRAGELRRTTPD